MDWSSIECCHHCGKGTPTGHLCVNCNRDPLSPKRVEFYQRTGSEKVACVRPETGSVIIFSPNHKKWGAFSRDYDNLKSDENVHQITTEEANIIFGDVLPNEKLLDELTPPTTPPNNYSSDETRQGKPLSILERLRALTGEDEETSDE